MRRMENGTMLPAEEREGGEREERKGGRESEGEV